MRVRTAERVARRAMVVRRFLRAVPSRQCIEVSLLWLVGFGFLSGLAALGLSVPLVFSMVQWALTHSR